MGYFREGLKGTFWVGGFRVLSRVIAFGRISILARLLNPAQFGMYGIAALVLSLLEIFTATGINVFLIQDNRKIEDYVDTAFIISIIRGLFIFSVLFLLSPFIGKFFNSPNSIRLVKIIAFVALVRGFINPSRASFQKYLRFDREFVLGVAVLFTDVTVAITLAYKTRLAESLVWGLLAGSIVEVFYTQIFLKPRAKLSFDMVKAKKILSSGKWITGSRIFSYLFKEGDDAVVGRLLNTSALGYYQMAYKISTLPITEVSQVINKVTLPIYTNIKGDRNRLVKALIKTFLAVFVIVTPLSLLLLVYTKYFVGIVLGNDWLVIVPILKLLILFGVIQSLLVISIPLFLSTNNQKYQTITSFTTFIIMAVSIVPLVKLFGIYGAGISVLIGSILSIPIYLYYIYKSLKPQIN
jgi:PST family polysaccharide transporter